MSKRIVKEFEGFKFYRIKFVGKMRKKEKGACWKKNGRIDRNYNIPLVKE